MRPLRAVLATMLLVALWIVLSQNAANASSLALASTPTATRTFTPVPLTIAPGTAYVHPSGLFSFQLPSDAYFDPSLPPDLATPTINYDYTRAGRIAFMTCTTIHVEVERFHNVELRTLADLNRTLDRRYFNAAWAYFPDRWKEVRRRTDGSRLVVDFELYGDRCGDQLARQVSRRYGDWMTTLRLIVPRDNPGLLDDLVKFVWPSLMTYDDAVQTPLNWSASIDPITGYVLKYPADAVVLNNRPGDVMLVLATVANTRLMIRARGEQSKAVYSEKQARDWVTAQYPDARMLAVLSETRANATGFTVLYTIPSLGGSEGSGLTVLLNGNNGTLYSAEYIADSAKFNPLVNLDLSAVQDLVNLRRALILIPSTPVNSLGTLWLLPSSTPVEPSPTPTATAVGKRG